jgi:hypothetical protein
VVRLPLKTRKHFVEALENQLDYEKSELEKKH